MIDKHSCPICHQDDTEMVGTLESRPDAPLNGTKWHCNECECTFVVLVTSTGDVE